MEAAIKDILARIEYWKYEAELSNACLIGILEIIKYDIMTEMNEDIEPDGV